MLKVKTKITDSEREFKFVFHSWPLVDNLEYRPCIFEWAGIEFCYNTNLGGFFIPDNVYFDIKGLLEVIDFDLSDWNLKRVSETPNPKYILNQYLRGGEYPCIPLDLGILKNNKSDFEGDWILDNGKDVSIEFTSKTRPSPYVDCPDTQLQILICYPEKTEIPYDPVKIINKSNFIYFIICKKLLLKK